MAYREYDFLGSLEGTACRPDFVCGPANCTPGGVVAEMPDCYPDYDPCRPHSACGPDGCGPTSAVMAGAPGATAPCGPDVGNPPCGPDGGNPPCGPDPETACKPDFICGPDLVCGPHGMRG